MRISTEHILPSQGHLHAHPFGGTCPQDIAAKGRKHHCFQLQGIIHPHTHDGFRNFELSLQSPLHPSIALLVRYRSHTGIQP